MTILDQQGLEIKLTAPLIRSLEGDQIELNETALGTSAMVDLKAIGHGCLSLSVKDGIFDAALLSVLPAHLTTTEQPATLAISERSRLQFHFDKDQPGALVFCFAEPFVFYPSGISSLTFLESYVQDETTNFEISAVTRGELVIPEVKETHKLSVLDQLSLHPRGAQTRITFDPDINKFNVQSLGVAQDVTLGTGRIAQNLTPTLAEFAVKSDPVAVILGLFGLAWGAIWGGVHLLRSKME